MNVPLRLLRSSRLGEGAAGNVWEAENLLVGRHVAVKILHPTVASRPDMQQRFLAEARLSAKLAHPNVVDVYDLGRTDEGTPYIVMELLDGETLGHRLHRQKCLPVPITSRFMSQAARALDRAHALGIVHRDLKPENIVIVSDEDGKESIKVLDFGVAKLSAAAATGTEAATGRASIETTLAGNPGTPVYMSPEQLFNRDIDGRSDLYSAGVIL